MAASQTAYQRHKDVTRRRQAEISAAGRDIASRMRPVADPLRRAACKNDFRQFVETYILDLFTQKNGAVAEHWPWADYHLRMMERIEGTVLRGEKSAFAVPRGGGKTTLIQAGTLWAILYGHRRWVCIIAATGPKASEIADDIKTLLETNPKLAADFPEVTVPIESLERIANRQKGQTFHGKPTRLEWGESVIVIADIPGSPAAQARVTWGGLEGAFVRGQGRNLPDGTRQRPDLVLIDDPQTDESALSEYQTKGRLNLLNGAVLEMGPPGKPLAGLMAVTVITQNDMADQVLRSPEWNCTRIPMLVKYPIHRAQTDKAVEHGDLWDRYSEFLSAGMEKHAADLYAAHRCKPECETRLDKDRECLTCERRGECMDCGAVVSWISRKYQADLSAVQHAMNRSIRKPDQFAAEMQQAPNAKNVYQTTVTPAQVMARVSGLPAGMVPGEATKLTAFIDVHDEILYYTVCAWTDGFTGWIIDYGTYPEQPTKWFRQSDPPRRLSQLYGGSKGAVLAAGLEALSRKLLDKEFACSGGGVMSLERLLVDSRYEPLGAPRIVDGLRRKLKTPIFVSAKGRGINAKHKPISMYTKRPGWTLGDHWYIPDVRGTKEFPYVSIDTNHWKSFVHTALSMPIGTEGALLLFGTVGREADHEQFAEHIAASEYYREVTAQFTVNEWSVLPNRPDNHWFDCLVGCFVGASMLGCKVSTPAEESKPAAGGKRKFRTLSDMKGR